MHYVGSPPPSSTTQPPVASGKNRLTAGDVGFSFIPDTMPERYRRELIHELNELEEWATSNRKDAKRDTFRFWIFKVPAVVASSCAGAFGYFGLEAATVVSGAIGSICILVDGVNPGGRLRNVHLRAVHDLRQLQTDIKSTLRYTAIEQEWDATVKSIFDLVHSERRRIGGYLREAETALGEVRDQG